MSNQQLGSYPGATMQQTPPAYTEAAPSAPAPYGYQQETGHYHVQQETGYQQQAGYQQQTGYQQQAAYQQQPTAYAGYQQPQQGYAPQPKAYEYQQAAPQYGATSNTTNVVVVGQPMATPAVVVAHRPRPPDYLVLSVVLFVVCFLCGMWQLHLCLIPALIFSIVASSQQDYESGRSFGRAALGCNITAILFFIVSLVVGGVLIALAFTGVLFQCCYYDIDGDYICTLC